MSNTSYDLVELVQNNQAAAIQDAVRAGAELNGRYEDGGLLHYAVLANNADILDILLQAGVDQNLIKDAAGRAPLHLAASANEQDPTSRKIRTSLLLYGADVNMPDNNGDTPLNVAARAGNLQLMEVLLGAGAEPTLGNGMIGLDLYSGAATAAHVNGYWRLRSPMLRRLVESGVDVNIRDQQSGDTLLLRLAKSGAPASDIKMVVDAGADVTAQDNDGSTAYKYYSQRAAAGR